MDVVKVVVENWPKAKPLLLEWVPVIIAGVAIIISIYSIYLSRKDFIASHRPYVWAATFSNPVPNKMINDSTVMISCVNAPAIRTREEYTYIAEKSEGCEDILHTDSELKMQVIYPVGPEKNQVTYTMSGYSKLREAIDDMKIRRILRRVRIDYKEISSNREYFFEGEWEYDREGQTWKPITLTGN